jgi:hypothetical protein
MLPKSVDLLIFHLDQIFSQRFSFDEYNGVYTFKNPSNIVYDFFFALRENIILYKLF